MKSEKKVIRDVQVANISNVPALYFFRPKVIAAVRHEVLNDIKGGRNVRVPAGCKGIYGRQTRWANYWQIVKAAPGRAWKWVKG